jgi:hypothetical protein
VCSTIDFILSADGEDFYYEEWISHLFTLAFVTFWKFFSLCVFLEIVFETWSSALLAFLKVQQYAYMLDILLQGVD